MKAQDLAVRLEWLFVRCPDLAGFSVRAENDELILTDVCVSPEFGAGRYDEISERIATVLSELLDERPEAAELLRGRTFARTLH